MSTLIVSAASILVMELACLVPSTLIATLDSVKHVAVTPEPPIWPQISPRNQIPAEMDRAAPRGAPAGSRAGTGPRGGGAPCCHAASRVPKSTRRAGFALASDTRIREKNVRIPL